MKKKTAMIAIPLMTPGEKLRQLREQQPKRVTRADVADALNERNKLNRITVAIIRDIEMGLSAKWLPTYIDFAISQWGADRAWIDSPDPEGSSTIPVIQESSAAYHTLPLQLLPLWQGTPLEYDLEFRPTKKYIRAEVNLPDSMEEYFAAEVLAPPSALDSLTDQLSSFAERTFPPTTASSSSNLPTSPPSFAGSASKIQISFSSRLANTTPNQKPNCPVKNSSATPSPTLIGTTPPDPKPPTSSTTEAKPFSTAPNSFAPPNRPTPHSAENKLNLSPPPPLA